MPSEAFTRRLQAPRLGLRRRLHAVDLVALHAGLYCYAGAHNYTVLRYQQVQSHYAIRKQGEPL